MFIFGKRKTEEGAFPVNKFILRGLLVIWIVFSFGYIGYDRWTQMREDTWENAFMSGAEEGAGWFAEELVGKIEKNPCEPIEIIIDGETRADVVSGDCIRAEDGSIILYK